MCEEKEIYIEGEPFTQPVNRGSLSQFVLDKWRTHDPNKTLLIDSLNEEKLTSQELLHKSLKSATSLQKLGLKTGDVISFYAKTSINLCIAAYGTLLAGGIGAPIDPNLKEHELRLLLTIHRPKFIFIEQSSLPRIQQACDGLDFEIKIVFLDKKTTPEDTTLEDLMKVTVDYDNYQTPPVSDPDNDLVLILSSSGTTGLPKGVGLTHNGMMYQMMYWIYIFDCQTYLQITQFFWVTAINQWLSSIINEMCRILVREFSPEQCCKAVEKYKTQWCVITPVDMTSWLRYPDLHKYDLSSMKLFGMGGTPMPKHMSSLFHEKLNFPVTHGQAFGATELSGICTTMTSEEYLLSIGKPLPGMKVKIVDRTSGKSLGPEESGEICMKGPSIMKGYVSNEEATRKAVDGDGWYHTGDAGHYTQDHYIYITGRYKEIFKFRAAHISPIEMEEVISSLSGVREVGVVGIPHPEDVNQPMAIVVREEGSSVTAEDIIAQVAEKMADTRRLAAGVRFVDDIPKTSTGKIKRVELHQLGLRLYKTS